MADQGAIGKKRGRRYITRATGSWQNDAGRTGVLPELTHVRRPFLRKQMLAANIGDIFGSFKRPNNGVISGIVTEDGDPVPHCLVRLYHRATGLLMESTFSDGLGLFSFPGYDQTVPNAFFAVAFDPDGGTLYNALIFDRQTPYFDPSTIPARSVGVQGSINGALFGSGFVGDYHVTLDSASKDSQVTLSEDFLSASWPTTAYGGARADLSRSTGKWYWEQYITTYGGTDLVALAVIKSSVSVINNPLTTGTGVWSYRSGGGFNGQGNYVSGASTFTAGDTVMWAVDIDGGKLWLGKNGSWYNSGAPGAGSNPFITGLSGPLYPAMAGLGEIGACEVKFRFGTSSFAYSIPSGFNAYEAVT